MFSQVTQIGTVYQIPPTLEALQWCKILPDGVNDTTDPRLSSEGDFDRLLPTLFECFAIVFCGFLAGRCGIIPDIKGLHDFTTYFSLPPLIFLNLVMIDFRNVEWLFIASVLVAKWIVFGLVAAVTLALRRPESVAHAGIYGIFCTQGNDFGLAYPIVASLYGGSRPLYQGYMYLIAPTSLLFLNPIGFLLMEVQRNKGSRALHRTAINIIRNPVVFVTMLGVLANFLFHGNLPSLFFGVLQIMSSAFSACVLFLLGFSVAGTGDTKYLKKEGLLVPSMLLITKMLVSPLVTRTCVSVLCAGAADQSDLADYGFLYGMVPTGPIVMLFAAEYGLQTEMMASTMVVCTGLFGPAVYVLAKMVSLNIKGLEEYSDELRTTMLVLSILSLIGSVCLGLSFFITSKIKQRTYRVTGCLLIAKMLLCLGVLVWSCVEEDAPWLSYLEVSLISGGQLMCRLWAALLAFTLLMQKRNPESHFILNDMFWFHTIGFGFPLLAVLVLLILTSFGQFEPDIQHQLPLFICGKAEAIASVVILFLCLASITISLVLHFRTPHFLADIERKQSIFKTDVLETDFNQMGSRILRKHQENESSYGTLRKCCSESSTSEKQLLGSETSSPIHECKPEGRMHLRHVIYLIITCISMTLGLTISIWKLSTNQPNSLFVAIEFLDAVLNVGQGFLIFIVFIKEAKYIFNPMTQMLRRGVYWLRDEDADPLVQQLCHQFTTYHRENCLRDLPRSIKKEGSVYDQSFTGSEMTDWLIQVGLANHRSVAEVHAQRLMHGGLLQSSDSALQFHDSDAYLYRIT